MATDNTVTNVTAGKPAVGGAIFIAPPSTTLPTDATTALDGAFENVGYISEDGLTNSNSPTVETVKAWGGDTVLTTSTERPDTFKYTLIEVLNTVALKHVYGSANVSGTLATGIVIKANNNAQEEWAIVIEQLLRDNAVKRIVIPRGSVTEVGDITYTDSGAVGYETTVTAQNDSNGNTHYEYIKRATS